MSRRDYASKPRAGKSATRATAAKPAKPVAPPADSRRSPIGLIVAILIAAGLLAGLLYFLIDNTPQPPAPASPPAPAAAAQRPAPAGPASEPRQPGEGLPLDEVKLEQERFEFYKLLQQSEVQTPQESAYTSTPKSAALESKYLLQAGSFRNSADAEAMRAKLTLSGLPNVRSTPSEGSNGLWYRVTTGPFTTYAELKSATGKLERLNIHPIKRKVD